MLKSEKKSIVEILGRRPIHPFPARMAPGIALEALGKGGCPLRVLDPMAGSGTVLAVARANGHRAFGVDLDPLAVLLAGVWTRTVDAASAIDKAAEVLDRARSLFRTLRSSQAYPSGTDEETRQFIRFWFDEYARRQLTALSLSISRVRDETIRNVLWCGFSRLIITKKAGASLAMDLSHSRPHRAFVTAPIKPFNRFLAAVNTVVTNCPQLGSDPVGPMTRVKRGDARRLDIPSSSIDLVLTSPPYLNAIDYIRCSKFSLVWMGHSVNSLRKIRGESVGAQGSSKESLDIKWVSDVVNELRLKPAISPRNHALLSQYVLDIGGALAETSRVLRSGGRAVYVVGDSTVRGTFISNSQIVVSVARDRGMVLRSRQFRSLPANRRYLPPPRSGDSASPMDSRMRREAVLVFCKEC